MLEWYSEIKELRYNKNQLIKYFLDEGNERNKNLNNSKQKRTEYY